MDCPSVSVFFFLACNGTKWVVPVPCSAVPVMEQNGSSLCSILRTVFDAKRPVLYCLHPDFRHKQSYYTDRAFISVTVRLFCITANSLRFTTFGGKYPWQDFHLQELCHARHTKKYDRGRYHGRVTVRCKSIPGFAGFINYISGCRRQFFLCR